MYLFTGNKGNALDTRGARKVASGVPALKSRMVVAAAAAPVGTYRSHYLDGSML